MTNVVTMEGAPLMDVPRLLEYLASRNDIESFAAVLLRKDGFTEVIFTRQTHAQLVFAAAALNHEVQPMIGSSIIEPT